MTRERIDLWCERGILALVLVILCFGPLANGAVRTLEFLIVQGLATGVLIFWFIRMWWGEPRQLLWPPVCWPILGFAAYAIGRYVSADIEYVGRWELLRVLVYTVLFFAVLNNLHRQENFQIIAYTVIGVAVVLTFIAVWQFLSGTNKVPTLGSAMESWLFRHKTWYIDREYHTRASGTYVNPNHMAGFLEMLLPLALAYTMIGRGRAVTKIFLGYASLAMMAGIGVSVSRGSWIATTLILLLFFAILAIHNTHRVPALVLMFLLVMGCTFFIARTEFFQRRFRDTFASGRIEQDTRILVWDATLRMYRDHPWFGVGPGHFDFRFREYRPEEIQLRPDRAHNEFLNLLADWGVIGAAIVAWALLCVFVGVVQTWKHVRRPESEFAANRSNKFSFFLGTFLGLLAVLVHSSVDFNMQIPANAILVFCLAALLSSQLRHATDKYWVEPGVIWKGLLSLALLGFVGYGSAQGVRLAREYRWLTLAEGESWKSGAQVADLGKAFEVEPRNFETSFAIAEAFQIQSKQGGEDNAELATNAITWFQRGIELNRYDGRNFAGCGWAWDWIALRQDELSGLHDLAEKNFLRAEALDPKGYWMIKDVGLHFVQAGNYAAARMWFERSQRLKRTENEASDFYYLFSSQKLAEAATNRLPVLFR